MNKTLQALNLVAFIGVLIMNFLAVTLPLFGRSTGEIADQFPSLFTPAGFTFSIWSVIYLLLGVFVIRQARGLFNKRMTAPEEVPAIGWLFIINCIFNMAWIVAWHSLNVTLAMALMLGILITLILIYQRLAAADQIHWSTTLPFSIYLGWITVATIANASVVLLDNDWGGFGLPPETWTAIMIGAGTLIGMAMLWRARDTWFVLVLIWAFFGIYSKRSGAEPYLEIVVSAAMVGMFLLLLTSVAVGLLKFRR